MKFELNPFHRDTPSEVLLADLKRVAGELGQDTVSVSEYSQKGEFHPDTLIKRFGSWNRAVEQAQLTKGMVFNLSDEDLFQNIEKVWVTLGRQPKATEVRRPLSNCSIRPYLTRFGSWHAALRCFVEYINQDKDRGDAGTTELPVSPKVADTATLPKRRTSREISHRLRFRILMRDGFRCRKCGSSPLNSPGIELHVDHILPWTKGGETVPDNLETKCATCNLGKGNAFDS